VKAGWVDESALTPPQEEPVEDEKAEEPLPQA